MCKCTPNIRTPFCGKPGCEWPKQVQPDYEELYHQAMDALRGTKMQHGLCKPVERNACTHCMSQRRLDSMLAEYKGRPIRLA